MDRRELLLKTPLWLGAVVTSSTITQILSSCTSNKNINWKPVFLDNKQAFIVENLVAVILPKSTSIGALDVHVPQFIDLILKDVFSKEIVEDFNSGITFFEKEFQKVFQKDIREGTKEEFLKLITTYFNQSKEKQDKIFELLDKPSNEINDKQTFYIYKFLMFVRQYAIYGYMKSEKVVKELLQNDTMLGYYDGCVAIE